MFLDTVKNNEIETNKLVKTFAQATDEEITYLLGLHKEGIIDLTEYWSVGDERTIHLNAMSAMSPFSDVYPEQNVLLKILHGPNAFDLSDDEGGGKNIFVIGIIPLLGFDTIINGRPQLETSSGNSGGWKNCTRRPWFDNIFREALPTEVKKWFKKFKYLSYDGYGTTTSSIIENYFTLPSVSEVFGPSYNTNYVPSSEDSVQFDLYKNNVNKYYKFNKIDDSQWSMSTYGWWLRSSANYIYNNIYYYCYCTRLLRLDRNTPISTFGFAPFGVV